MSATPRAPGAARVLGSSVSFLLCAGLAGGLAAFGHATAALGVSIGLALHSANVALLYMTLQSLVGGGDARRAGALAGISAVGRLLVLGLALAGVVVGLGREAFFGAAGGLALAQISLFFRRSGAEGGA